jgi:hypothetical protein
LSFGLRYWGHDGAATDAWRQTLAGRLPTPVPARRLHYTEPGKVRVEGF